MFDDAIHYTTEFELSDEDRDYFTASCGQHFLKREQLTTDPDAVTCTACRVEERIV